MKNPLMKRWPRELKKDAGKYVALFLFLFLTISFCAGFLVADGSMKRAYDQSFEKYKMESGHFILNAVADQELLDRLKQEDISIYELFYKDKELENDHAIRIYSVREEINLADIMEGRMPETSQEIVIDRLYAENNGILVGDHLKIDEKDFTVCGFVALSDYSALFKNNTDMMFDANRFTVALVMKPDFEALTEAGLQYCYAWRSFEANQSDIEIKAQADEIKEILAKTGMLTDFVARPDNQAIMFTGNDMGGDKLMIEWLLYIVMVVLGFAFAVTTRSTIEEEASAIGTLLSSGYSRGELLRHYMFLPVMVTLAAAIAGNICGYAAMKNVIVSMYYHSYSLPTYVTVWNVEAFILTTVIPCCIILVINWVILSSALSLSPLQFLRHNLTRRKKKRIMRLPRWKFLTRFRVRVITQNMPAYLTMFVGILFASVLLLFGMMFTPLLKSFKAEVLDSKIANYQYILKAPLPTEVEGAEKYAVCSLQNGQSEEIMVLGISEASKYLADMNFSLEGVVVSDGYMEKYGLKLGDTITLQEKYGNHEYTFTVAGDYHYPASLCIFMPLDAFNECFDQDENYFSGYFSDRKLLDIQDTYIASTITEYDLTVIANQLEDSMGMVFPFFGGFAILIYIIMIYLLAKLIVEKNVESISMVKILGYTNQEISRLYNTATAIVAVLSLIISIPISYWIIKSIYYLMMQKFSGWLTYYVAPWIYPVMLLIGTTCYFVVHLIQMKKISRIPLAQAMKNME